MNVTVNGSARTLEHGTTVGALIDAEVPDRRGVAVVVDGDVVARAQWDQTHLYDGARVEIVTAVQGGAGPRRAARPDRRTPWTSH